VYKIVGKIYNHNTALNQNKIKKSVFFRMHRHISGEVNSSNNTVFGHKDPELFFKSSSTPPYRVVRPIPLSKRSKVRVCGRSPFRIAGSNPYRDRAVCFECCKLSGISLCEGPIPRSEDSYRVCGWVCVSLVNQAKQ
jgi:hypothetical protein